MRATSAAEPNSIVPIPLRSRRFHCCSAAAAVAFAQPNATNGCGCISACLLRWRGPLLGWVWYAQCNAQVGGACRGEGLALGGVPALPPCADQGRPVGRCAHVWYYRPLLFTLLTLSTGRVAESIPIGFC
jgi:hypothetical protein